MGQAKEAIMLTRYIQAVMHRARYEILPDDGTFYGEIPGFQGVWANAATLEACREELEEVLEEWILLGVAQHHPLPVIDGIDLTVREVA
jgi:predicted RNase H-like HicB family nuclease